MTKTVIPFFSDLGDVVKGISLLIISGFISLCLTCCEFTSAASVKEKAKDTLITSRVTVHDPSIIYDNGTYYIFGSHVAFAKSTDLMNWTMFENESSLSKIKYGNVFAQSAGWSKNGSSNYNITGNLWAPDVIYNKAMDKYCMYMSVNGDRHYSSIAMATADNIEGPYTYKGTVVYSGFITADLVAKTDYEQVTGESNPNARYLNANGTWDNTYGTNAIDPCVLYDKDGNLWMVYGSWFGGLFILALDENTGLRDYNTTYELDLDASDGDASDPYLGKRILGGYGGTGEGPYIIYDQKEDYYYLYASYCGLNATDTFSGYQMRLFRSKNIDGPYLDPAGNNAIRTSSSDNQNSKGVKIMGNYYFSSLATAPDEASAAKTGYKSPGHNSAIIDEEGNHFLIYHTRFNNNTEWHQVRVHQQFVNKDGWLVTAPYEYRGNKISKTGYSDSEIVGTYEFINHGNDADTNKVHGMLTTKYVTLTSDGKITGDVVGTWQQEEGTPYATIVIGGISYKGVFFKQHDESAKHENIMTFSVIGNNNIALWGSRIGS